jgi:hypothetical protein
MAAARDGHDAGRQREMVAADAERQAAAWLERLCTRLRPLPQRVEASSAPAVPLRLVQNYAGAQNG